MASSMAAVGLRAASLRPAATRRNGSRKIKKSKSKLVLELVTSTLLALLLLLRAPAKMLRCLLLLLALHASAGLVLAPASAPRAVGGRAAAVSMAHHVQKKATKHHASSRPKKSRLSDRNRRPPSYPSLPEKPWMTPVDSLSGAKKQTVTITVAPGDDVASLKTKLSAAGASAEEFVFQGTPVTGTLGDAGLEAEASFEAVVKG